MKILVLGCGSIGRRHARNARSLGVKRLILVDPDIAKARSLGSELGTELVYVDHETALGENPDLDAAVICTPSSMHVRHAVFFARNGISLLIEKPLSDSLMGTSALLRLRKKNKLVIMMAHSFIFEPGLIRLKSILGRNTIGRIYFASYLNGQYLPEWHPLADYKKEYTAKRNLGGGALLTMSSHSFYLLEWLFGQVSSIHGSYAGRIGSLKIDVDDSAFLLMRTKGGVVLQSQNNFVTRVHQHRLAVDGSKGIAELDLLGQKITVTLRGKKPRIIPIKADRNDKFVAEMRYFLKTLKTRKIREDVDLDSGIRFLSIVKLVKRFPTRSGL